MIQIPLTNQPNQSFRLSITRGEINIPLSFLFYWNRIAEYWQMNIANGLTDSPILQGLPLLTGQDPAQNILRQYQHLNIGSAYVVPVAPSTRDYPGIEDWSKSFILVWT